MTSARVVRPATAASAKSTSSKAEAIAIHVLENENLSEVDDPIAQCTQDRLKNGGLGITMTEAEAKAKKIKVVKVQKVLTSNKATAPLLDFTEG